MAGLASWSEPPGFHDPRSAVAFVNWRAASRCPVRGPADRVAGRVAGLVRQKRRRAISDLLVVDATATQRSAPMGRAGVGSRAAGERVSSSYGPQDRGNGQAKNGARGPWTSLWIRARGETLSGQWANENPSNFPRIFVAIDRNRRSARGGAVWRA